MPQTSEEIYARVVAAVDESGRLPMPPVGEWDIFPWELVDGALQPKVLTPPVAVEEPRNGEGGKPCWTCAEGSDELVIWRNEHWKVTRGKAPTGLPLMLWLHPVEHLDGDDLDEEMAAEYGQLQVRLSRIMAGLPNIGRVHVCRWGDGGAHLHLWFIARPDRFPIILGSMAVEWDEMLPPGPEDVWHADWTEVARKLATHEGEALV
ncbi:hypothetical protein [Nocardioides jensenii]|uniref:hypothetical protein n=1 Tax=Nocardioides jensenii TaxID=1843 RepID=UPI000833AE3F|nr:hypothetical protein [Nocardioides jensenii]